MSAGMLRDSVRKELQVQQQAFVQALLNDTGSDAGLLHDKIGFIRGLAIAEQILDNKYADLNR